MRVEHLIESQVQNIAMSEAEATDLQVLGKTLASQSVWWGAPQAAPEDRTVIRCNRANKPDTWSVRVNEAIGIVAIPGLQLIIKPKIPTPHLFYLFEKSGQFPRLEQRQVEASIGDSLLELVAEWFVSAAELVLRRGLMRDYHETSQTIPFLRGRLDVPDAIRNYYAGRTDYRCNFENFGLDTPLNRVLKAAAREVLTNQLLRRKSDLRKRATRITNRLTEVGRFQPSDLRTPIDRRTHYYRSVNLLAQQLLCSNGRHLSHGNAVSHTFLIRTPEMIEEGLRKVLKERCTERTIYKKGIKASSITFNPDIVIDDGSAIADVKYKLATNAWSRPDFNEVVTFAVAYRATHAAIVNFRSSDTSALPDERVGNKTVVELSWPIDGSISPDTAASEIAGAFSRWMQKLALA